MGEYRYDGRVGFLVSIVGLVGVGILHWVPSLAIVGFILALCSGAGLIYSILELNKSEHRGMAIGGIVLSLAGMAYWPTLIGTLVQNMR